MASFQFKFNAEKQSEPTYQYRSRQCWDRFYERSPHFIFSEVATGAVVISDLDGAEARILGEALASGTEPDIPGQREPRILTGCIGLDPESFLASLEAIGRGDPVIFPVDARRRQEYPAARGRKLPREIEVPKFTISSIAGNLFEIRKRKAAVISQRLAVDTISPDGINDSEEYHKLVQHGTLAGQLAIAAETTIREGLDAVHEISVDTLTINLLR